MKQVSLFQTKTQAGSITGMDIPQDTVELRDWVCDDRFIRAGQFPAWRYCDWGNRYGSWARDYQVLFIGMGANNICYGMLPCGRIDEFGQMELFPINN